MLIKMKQETTFEQMLEGQPIEFIDYMNYVRNLTFDQRPDYSYIKRLFEGLMLKNGWEVDYQYDWVLKKQSFHKQPSVVKEEEQKV